MTKRSRSLSPIPCSKRARFSSIERDPLPDERPCSPLSTIYLYSPLSSFADCESPSPTPEPYSPLSTIPDSPCTSPTQCGAGQADPHLEEEEEVHIDTRQFIEHLRCVPVRSSKLRLTRYRSSFILKNMDQCPDPEAVLERALEDALDDAIEDARTFGIQPTHAQIYINSTLLETPMKIRLRKIADNPIWSIVNLISKYNQQSAKNGSLFGAPIEVDITTAQCHGGCGRKKNAVRHNINTASLIEFDNQDAYCLFYALELGRLKHILPAVDFYNKRKYLNKVKKDHVLPLMEEAHIPLDLDSYDAETWVPVVQALYEHKYPGQFKIFVFGSHGAYKPAVMGHVGKYQHAVCIFHEINELGNHFHTIGCINRFFKDSYYCFSCLAPYDRGTKHASKCKARCFACSRVGPSYPCPKEADFTQFCDQCLKKFGNKSCYDFHHANKVCDKLKKCPDCGVFYSTTKRKDRPNGHVCGETFCRRCHTYHEKESGCYIQKKEADQETVYRLMVYDFESEQTLQPNPDVPKFLHEVNFVAAYIMCTKCIAAGTWKDPLKPGQCDICGDHRSVTWGHRPYFKTTVDKRFVCVNPLSDFLKWSLNELNPEYETYAYAHFGGRYDMTLTLGEIIQNTGIQPEMVRAGLKMYKMDIVTRNKKENPICQTRFRDSFNLIPVALDKMVKTFKLDIESKYDFAHLWNCQANYGVTLPHLPDKEFYCYGGMKKEKQAGFDARYEKEYNTEFLLDEKLPEYCVHDVRVLAHSLVSYRQLILDVSHDDVLCHSVTIASAAMRHWQCHHLEENTVAITPEGGYERHDTQSKMALKFLSWYAKKNRVKVRDRNSKDGEYRYRKYRLDGFVERPGKRNLAIEVNGCVFHGCPHMNRETICPNKKTAQWNYEQFQDKAAQIIEEMDLEVYWECDIARMLAKDPEMKQHFRDHWEDNGAIDPRQAFYGGRTGPLALYAQATPGYVISYKDYTSLYPSVNLNTRYPVSHAKVTVPDSPEVNWTAVSDNPYEGLLKVKDVPPRKTMIPVLPNKFDDERLLFALCRSCAMDLKSDIPFDYECPHEDDDERAFIVTLPHIEINLALENGYKVTALYRVWEFDVWKDDLFTGYVQEFVKIKVEASKWPDTVKDDEELKKQYIIEYLQMQGINIDPEKVGHNEGMRYVAKLFLNSLWGRFGIQNRLSKVLFTTSPHAVSDILNQEDLYDVNSIDMLDDERVCIVYTPKEHFVEEGPSANVIIALWTTSAARVKLYGAMKTVAMTPGCKLVYTDTDSLIYVHPAGSDPLPDGKFLGELVNEYPDDEILEYVSGGAKQYGLMTRNKKDGTINYHLKLRGITMDINAAEKLSYEIFRERVLQYGQQLAGPPRKIILSYSGIRPTKMGQVFTYHYNKNYDPVVLKGIRTSSPCIDIAPFGYKFSG